MKNLNVFLNPKKVEAIKAIISDRFIDPDTNKPIEWEIGAISGKRSTDIQNECAVTNKINGKAVTDFDTAKYMNLICANSVVYPDLNNAELQDAYGVKSAEDLLGIMLTGGEMTKLQTIVNKINNLDGSFDELVKKAKN